MDDGLREKSRGLTFAERQLLRHGWKHGKGLGRAENGISEAIKVKVKCDKGGVGHKEGEQFSFHWWDHVFNKASSSLQVEADQNGIKLKKTEDEEDETISNKKPRKALQAKTKLYGCFVKSATLLSGQEQPEPKSSNDSGSSDEEEEHKLDLSSTTKLDDSDLIKACGGRTAHKGARHGLTMSAKLARLERQEAEFMAKYRKKSQPTDSRTPTLPSDREEGCREKKKKNIVKRNGAAASREENKELLSEFKVQKKKKKKSSHRADEPVEEEENGIDKESSQADHKTPQEQEVTVTTKKVKRKKSKKEK